MKKNFKTYIDITKGINKISALNKVMAKSGGIVDSTNIIWSMTDAEWAMLGDFLRGQIIFNDLPPAVKNYVKVRQIKSPFVEVGIGDTQKIM